MPLSEFLEIDKLDGQRKSWFDGLGRDADPLDLLPKHLLRSGLNVRSSFSTHKCLEISRVHISPRVFVEDGQLLVHVVERLSDNLFVAQRRTEKEQLAKFPKPLPDG